MIHGRVLVRGDGWTSLWPVGTKRLMDVTEMMPTNLSAIFEKKLDSVVFGDFEVCPMTPEKPGWLQGACIETASHLVIVPMK
jgi:hypothetical protein